MDEAHLLNTKTVTSLSPAPTQDNSVGMDVTASAVTVLGALRLVFRSWEAKVGAVILCLLVLCAVFAEQIAPYGAQEGDFAAAKRPPAWDEGGSWANPFGTDQLGQDVFSRIIYSARVSLTVGFFGVLLAMTIGLTAGMLAGYLGGWTDAGVTAVTNLVLSIPYLVLVVVVATIFGRSLLNVILIFGITNSPVFARLARAEVLRIKQNEYVTAANSFGATRLRIMLSHILPNLIGPVITLATFEMSAMIFYEAGLSFVGLSVPPEIPSWGNMLSLGRKYLTIYPWMAIFPGLAIAITALGVNLLGDSLRDTLDPRLRR